MQTGNLKKVKYNGIEFNRLSHGRYFLSYSRTNAGRKNPIGLHVAIWQFHNNKAVPRGYQVHHKDGNYDNNDPSNLECISKAEHQKMHHQALIKRSKSKESLQWLEKIRPLASQWHRSDEGRKWHSLNVKKHYNKIFKMRTVICSECRIVFKTRKSCRVFACKDCKIKRGERVRRIIKVACIICHKEFETRTHGKKTRKTCSNMCKYKLTMKNGGGLSQVRKLNGL